MKDITSSIDNRVIRKDSTLEWNGHYYSEEGDYDYRTTGQNGCDSIVTLHLRYLREDTIRKADTICSSELPYVWYGKSFDEPGIKDWKEITPEGDITYYILTLGVRENVVKDLRYSICMGEEVIINGKSYTRDTTFSFAHSCDTTYRVHITVNPSLLHKDEATFDGKSSYHWSIPGTQVDTFIAKAGTYYKYVHNETTGCNDTYRLVLREIKPDEATYLFDEELTVCYGEDFTWQGESRREWSKQNVVTKDYYVHHTTMYGNDSTYHLRLTVRPAPVVTHRIPFCDSLLWNNQWIKEEITI